MIWLWWIACGGPLLGKGAFTISVSADEDVGNIPFTTSFHADSDEDASFEWTFPSGSATGADVDWTFLASGEAEVNVLAISGDTTATATLTVIVESAKCPTTGLQKATGEVTTTTLNEISGVAKSRVDSDRLYVIEDANNAPDVVAISTSGEVTGTFSLPWATARDWEDIAVSRSNSDGVSRIYVADIGDNDPLDRSEVRVAVIEEPAMNANSDEVDGFEMVLTYPDAPHDAETLMVDPVNDDLYILTKDSSGPATLWRKPAPHTEGSDLLEEVLTLDFSQEPLSGGATTGGDISPLGDRIVVRTYSSTAWLWRRDQAQPFDAAFDSKPCEIDLPSELQGESIAFDDQNDWLWTVSELDTPDVNRTKLDN